MAAARLLAVKAGRRDTEGKGHGAAGVDGLSVFLLEGSSFCLFLFGKHVLA